MFTLTNSHLTVKILDPVADVVHMGARYCTGGYIYQVNDNVHGPLLTGPTYPGPFSTFNGQGIPDAFNLNPLRAVGAATEALIIGVGLCELKPNYQRNEVKSFCQWQIESQATAIIFRASQTHHDWSLNLIRTVSLMGRTLRSHTLLHNTGTAAIPLRWFPHPFYPQAPVNGMDELIKLNHPVTFADNAGYELNANGFICRKGWPWPRDYYLALDHRAQSNLVITQRHPMLGLISATCSYAPDFFPIWGNPQTFSWEPFFERMVAPGQSHDWWIDYDF